MRRDPALDGLRGVAIGLVVLHHVGALPGGWVGVSLFFTLSGYLITSLLLTEHDRTGSVSLLTFYRRRFVRLAPALLAALAGMWLLWTLLDRRTLATANVLVVLLYVANLARAFAPVQMTPSGWAWSLSLEEQFYLLWPITLRSALRRVSRLTLARWLLGLAAALMLLRSVTTFYVTYDLVRGDEMLLGAALALAPVTFHRRIVWPAAGAFMILSALHLYGHLSLSITAATLLAGVLVAGREHLPLTALPLRYLGRVSYSLYLWDGVLVAAWTEHEHGTPSTMSLLLVTAGAFVLSVLSTHLLEEPLRRRLHDPKPLAGDPGRAGRGRAVEVEPDVGHRTPEEGLRVVGGAGVIPRDAVRAEPERVGRR